MLAFRSARGVGDGRALRQDLQRRGRARALPLWSSHIRDITRTAFDVREFSPIMKRGIWRVQYLNASMVTCRCNITNGNQPAFPRVISQLHLHPLQVSYMFASKRHENLMGSTRQVRNSFFIVFGGLEIIAASTFIFFGHLADKSMGKDGVGDLVAFTRYNRVVSISFYFFCVCMMLAIIGFLVGKNTFREMAKPINLPASLPIVWVPFGFFVGLIAYYIL